MQPKCGEFNEKLEKIKNDFVYAKRLIEDFKKTGLEEEESIEFVIQNIEMSAGYFRERLTTSREYEAKEILGEENCVGSDIAQEIFGAMPDMHDYMIPFSLAELMQAKIDGKILLYRPDYSTGKITPEKLLTHIGFNDPQVNMKFFKDGHNFDFSESLKLLQQRALGKSEIEKSSWNLVQLHKDGTYAEAEASGTLPTMAEIFYDVLAAKKLSKFLRDKERGNLWTATGVQTSHQITLRFTTQEQSGMLAMELLSRDRDWPLPYYTCESRDTLY